MRLQKFAIAIFIDPSKAIDCVDHGMLLTKLRRYRVNFISLQWIKWYLSAKVYFVSNWNQSLSPTLNLSIGVPQQSILWQLFYLIYINDVINISFVLFAHDTTVYDRIYNAPINNNYDNNNNINDEIKQPCNASLNLLIRSKKIYTILETK